MWYAKSTEPTSWLSGQYVRAGTKSLSVPRYGRINLSPSAPAEAAAYMK
jgi:hypothetical protein